MKKLSLDEIKAGLLVADPVPETIEIMYKGEKCAIDIYIRPYNYDTAIEKFRSAINKKTDNVAAIIASSITDKKGKPQFTQDQVRKYFNEALTGAVWDKIHELNNPVIEKDEEGKPKSSSATTTKSGSNSLAMESADEPLPVPNET